ncbi:MAG TPA: DegQ family serine endoprotease [Stellaceae bacterium]|nr:DegQ family serine endoprotease [Stellaceae bacterium]
MSRLVFILVAVLLALPAVAQEARVPPPSREAIHFSFAPIVKKAAPAVVNVYSRRIIHAQSPLFNDPFFRRFFGQGAPFGMQRERVQNSLGSGVIVDPSGLIVTNHHVIKDAEEIRVVLSDRREFEAKVLLSDEQSDLAVLKIDAHGERLPTLPLGDSDTLEVGDLVLAIGNPFGVGQTVTSGIVSALARAVGVGDFRSFIQTDAAINPGNSGGALVDLDGKLVGINTAIFSRSGGSVGIGFAIPTAMVRMVLQAARSGGRIVRPWLGASVQAVTADLSESLHLPHPEGVLVKDVMPGSPAAQAGLRIGDVILAVNGRAIEDPDGLHFRIVTQPIGKPARLDYWRAGTEVTTSLTLVAPPETPPRDLEELDGHYPFAGATVGNLNPAFDGELGFDPTQRGVAVESVAGGSPAARLGLEHGDILASLDRRPIKTVAQLQSMLAAAAAPWTLTVKRQGRLLSVTVR